ncbi:DUF433 domain-containing protein [Telluribacter sp. SYSU D00476]|uniref:DUF433 domain-containing protein n=1 Tax=Telluribacter sp. SYSU D00476 TaxID=2811430 RepID=UPI001FF3763C|nr:DUF433 domain-containing protein [Telluribacter sp. SYSU D00476]
MTSITPHTLGFGTGIYTTPEVAKILRLPARKVKRWMQEYWENYFTKSTRMYYSEGVGSEQVTNFHTLIEFFVFYQLREKGISPQQIIKAHDVLASRFKTAYPFATLPILTDGRKILFTDKVGEIIDADASLQMYITDVIRPFCQRIEFDENQLARRFFPLGKDHQVVIDPERKFGQPVIEGTTILTETIYNLYRAGESVETIAKLYDLSVDQVQDALEFHRRSAA